MHESILLEIRTLLMKLRSPWGNSLVVKWLGLHVSIARDMGSIPGQGTKILQAPWYSPSPSKSVKCCPYSYDMAVEHARGNVWSMPG